MSAIRTRILPPASINEEDLKYVVIGAREGKQWLFVRHQDRMTWEMPAGHIEPGESADEAAARELYEETGTIRSSLKHLCDYQVSMEGKTESGRLYVAEIQEREALPDYEIAGIMQSGDLPAQLTYPEVQQVLFRELGELLRS